MSGSQTLPSGGMTARNLTESHRVSIDFENIYNYSYNRFIVFNIWQLPPHVLFNAYVYSIQCFFFFYLILKIEETNVQRG